MLNFFGLRLGLHAEVKINIKNAAHRRILQEPKMFSLYMQKNAMFCIRLPHVFDSDKHFRQYVHSNTYFTRATTAILTFLL